MPQKLITIITSTYNRIALLPKLYNSLKNQSSYNFEWIIVDDGSTDNTESLINKWQHKNNLFPIKYYYKENQGMFLACKLAIEKAETELIINVDSDDWLPFDVIEKIENIWNNIKNKNYVGIIGIDYIHQNGNCKHIDLPKNINEILEYKLYSHNIYLYDKKYVNRTDILKKVFNIKDFPKPGEKYFNPVYAINKTFKYGKHYCTNECFCHVKYRDDGLSKNKFLQYCQSPNNFGEMFRLHLSFPSGIFSYFFKESISYIAMYLIAGKPEKIFKDSPKKLYTLLAYPFGILYACKILIQNKKYKNDK